MRCSLFGKLAAKRDFIALFAPRDFLNAWEPWMQACVSASRDALGESWQQAYLTALSRRPTAIEKQRMGAFIETPA